MPWRLHPDSDHCQCSAGRKTTQANTVGSLAAKKWMVWELTALLSADFGVCIPRLLYCSGLGCFTGPALVIATHYSQG